MTGLNPKGVLSAYREIQSELLRAEGWRESMLKQYRELIDRFDAMEAKHESDAANWEAQRREMVAERIEVMSRVTALLADRAVITAERDMVVLALGFKALKALSAPVMVDRAMVERLIGVVG